MGYHNFLLVRKRSIIRLRPILLTGAFLIFGSAGVHLIPIDTIAAKSESALNEAVAVIGGRKITLQEFEDRYDEVKRSTFNPPDKTTFLEDLVRYEMGLLEAEKLNIKNDPIVQERIRQEIYKGLIEKALGKEIQAIKISDDEMKAQYKKYPELRTSHILIQFAPDSTDDKKQAALKRAQEIYKEVKESKRPFEELVSLYSDDTVTKSRGGDVDWQSNVTVVPNYYKTALSLKKGDVTGPVETPFGYHIIKLTGVRAYKDADKKQLRMGIFDEKRKLLFDQYFSKLKKQYKITKKLALLESSK